MDGLTFVADPFCCLENGPRIVCRVWRDKEHLMVKRDDLATAPLECAGKSIIEHVETQLDQVIRQLMEAAAGELEIPTPETVPLWRGQAQGLCEALAIMRNPYLPNIVAIKAEAMERYEAGLVPGEGIPAGESLVEEMEALRSSGEYIDALEAGVDILIKAAHPRVAAVAKRVLLRD